MIAAGAFWLSFTGLPFAGRHRRGSRRRGAALPFTIDGSLTQATVALLALAYSVHREHRAPINNQASQVTSPLHERVMIIGALRVQPPSAVPDSMHTPTSIADGTDHDVSAEAARLCARDPGRRRDPALVARALTHHAVDGWNPSRIATGRSTISRILKDAAPLHAHEGLQEPTGHMTRPGGLDVLVGDSRIGHSRVLEPEDIKLVDQLTARYLRLRNSYGGDGVLAGLGRALVDCLDEPSVS